MIHFAFYLIKARLLFADEQTRVADDYPFIRTEGLSISEAFLFE